MFEFAEKVLLVTGAASGIGRATAEYFFKCGASVFLADLNANVVAELAAKLDATGSRVASMKYDAGHSTDAKAAVDACMSRFGQIDFLVPCAGIYDENLIEDISDEQWSHHQCQLQWRLLHCPAGHSCHERWRCHRQYGVPGSSPWRKHYAWALRRDQRRDSGIHTDTGQGARPKDQSECGFARFN